MYLNVRTESSCARAWVAAAEALINAGDEAYNVIIDVDNPAKYNEDDDAVISLADSFLRNHDEYPIISVANTIFPEAIYREYGAPRFYVEYHKVYDKLTSKRWGRYFERMTRHRDRDGKQYNPLLNMIEKLKRQENAGVRYTAAYELAIYDPLLDSRSLYGGQCLSFLSFKVHSERGLLLTAMYRNHTYITRCLGILIGLSWLQGFIAKEAGLNVGPLTCISTHAELDIGKGWGIRDARKLVTQASEILKAFPSEKGPPLTQTSTGGGF